MDFDHLIINVTEIFQTKTNAFFSSLGYLQEQDTFEDSCYIWWNIVVRLIENNLFSAGSSSVAKSLFGPVDGGLWLGQLFWIASWFPNTKKTMRNNSSCLRIKQVFVFGVTNVVE